MSVYMIVEVDVQDSKIYAKYVELVPAVVEKHGGRYLVRGGTVTPLGGGWEPERVIVVEFDTADQLEQCFSSPEYLKLAPLRERSSHSRAIVVQGL